MGTTTTETLDQYEAAISERDDLNRLIQDLRAELLRTPNHDGDEICGSAKIAKITVSTSKKKANPIRQYRESLELNQVEAGEACGVSGQTIGAWERFESFPRDATIGELPRGWKRAARDLAGMA